MSKRCFVISPIGHADSPEREHADDVLEFIIKPAMDELGIYVYRADHTQQVGRITDQMFGSILNDDLCIAILTGHNPNVFYELAVAQSAARPVIILIEKGESIPFDIRDLRAIEYDLKPRPLKEKVYSKQIVEHVRGLEAINWKTTVPFGSHLTPLGNERGSLRVYDRVESFGTSDRSVEMLRKAKETIDLSGLSLRWWTKNTDFRKMIVEKAKEGCRIRFLLMHPENLSLTGTLNDTLTLGGTQRMAGQIEGTFAFFSALAKEHPGIGVRRIRNGTLHQTVTRSDSKMLVALLLYGETTARSPMIEIGADSPIFQTMEREFDALWNHNPPPEETSGPNPA